MSIFFSAWLVSAAVIMLIAYIYRSVRLKRAAKIDELHWPGMVVLSLLIGLAPAMMVDKSVKQQVEVPDGVGQKPSIVEK